MTVEEIADYLKLLGFDIEQQSNRTYVSTPANGYSVKLAELWDGIGSVVLYAYSDCTTLLDALSKGYTVTQYMGSRYFYDITNSNQRRSN